MSLKTYNLQRTGIKAHFNGVLFLFTFEKNITIMTNAVDLRACFKNLIGWRQHFNPDVQIQTDLTLSETGEYYQDVHPALQLNIIAQSLERGRDINDYLKEKVNAAITGLMNDVETLRQQAGAKDLLVNEVLLNKYGWALDTIPNEKRFVGFLFEPTEGNSLALIIKAIGFQFTIPQTLPVYLYHTSQIEPIAVTDMVIDSAISWNWINEEITLYSRSKNLQGGKYYIGYYQDDVLGYAINYTDFNWDAGHCGTCDGGRMRGVWDKLRRYSFFMPIYVPFQNLTDERYMFDAEAVMVDSKKSWGFNFQLAAACDYTEVFCKNRKHFKVALGLKVAQLILMDIKFSQEMNHINENIKNLIIMDLEGDKNTNENGIAARLDVATKNIYLDTSGLNKICLPCVDNGGVDYGAA